jgi:opacity protein-like surface antigen
MEGDYMRCKLWGIGLLASIVAGAGTAGAADLAVKAPPRAAPVYLSDWAGFYLGVHGGYGWGDTTFDDLSILNASPKGGVFGGHAGYNWQYQSVVGGLEVDFSGADINTSSVIATIGPQRNLVALVAPINISREVKIDELASARARLGYLIFPGLLAYGTAGIGWGHSELTLSAGPASISSNANEFGWVAGGGLEYKLMEHLLLRAEYLHYDFAKVSYFGVLNAANKVDVARAGLSYKF